MATLKGYNQRIEEIRSSEFPNLKDCVYLDHAGTTLYSHSQMTALHNDLLSNVYGNPHSRSQSSTLTTDSIDQVRYRVLRLLNASPDDYMVVFTSGCTGALKLLCETFDFTGRVNAPERGCDETLNTSESSTKSDKKHATNSPDSTSRNQERQATEKPGCFCYLLDNHTSVQGMREIAVSKGAEIICFEEADLMEDLTPQGNDQAERGEILESKGAHPKYIASGNSLWALPAQSNFSGRKYPLDWIIKAKNGEFGVQKSFPGAWFTLLDSAAFVSTSPLNLSRHKPDFVSLSFYKIFGYPTGLGALLIHRQAVGCLKKCYYGGGTIAVSTAKSRFHVDTPSLPERFEDGTVSFLDIISLSHGLDALDRLGGGMSVVSGHTFSLARYFHHSLREMHHGNGKPLAVLYCDDDFEDISTQGAIVSFNLLRANGEFAGYAEIDKLAQLHNIHLRTGCFCNIGACQKHLNLSEAEIRKNYSAGHVCGDNKDLVDGLPTGSVRVSFGYMSTLDDAQKCLQFIADCFLEGVKVKPVFSRSSCVIPPPPEHSDKNKQNLIKPVKAETTRIPSHIVSPPPPVNMNGKPGDICLTNIYLFPLKSCGAFEVSEWQLGPTGFLYDRNWMIITENGVSLGQKREPKLCRLHPTIDLEHKKLILNFPGVQPFEVPLYVNREDSGESETCSSKVCGDRISGTDCGDEVSDWLTEALGRPGCRLIQQAANDERKSKLKDADDDHKTSVAPMSLTNQSQFLLISRSSITCLQEKLKENQEKFQDEPVIETENLIKRFRGNLVINGEEGFTEETWTNVDIGDISLISQGRCSRCQMISMNQSTGEKSNEPLRTLGSWRGGKIPFGIYLRWNSEKSRSATIRVGDAVNVLTENTN